MAPAGVNDNSHQCASWSQPVAWGILTVAAGGERCRGQRDTDPVKANAPAMARYLRRSQLRAKRGLPIVPVIAASPAMVALIQRMFSSIEDRRLL